MLTTWVRPGPPLLRGSDAAVYAQVAREMAAAPLMRAAAPTLEGAPFIEHPPGAMMLLAAVMRSTAVWPALGLGATPRTVVGMAHVLMAALVVATMQLARRLAGPDAAAGAALGLCLLSATYAEAQNFMLELPLALALTLAAWALVELGQAERGPALARAGWLVAGALAWTAALWAKGPPALAALPLGAALCACGRLRPRTALGAGAAAAGLALGTVLLFELARARLGLPSLTRAYARAQLWPSMVAGRHHPVASPLYYLPVLWRWYAGGLLAAVPALACVWRARARAPGPYALAVLGAVWWLTVLLGFSAMRQKYQWYMHAALPAPALIVGAGWAALAERRRRLWRPRLAWALGAACALYLGIVALQPERLARAPATLWALQACGPMPAAAGPRRIGACCGPWGWRERYVARFVHDAELLPCGAPGALPLTTACWAGPRPG